MHTLARAALTTAVIAAPITIGANIVTSRSAEPFDQIPVVFATLATGGVGMAAVSVAGLTALRPQWRGIAAGTAGVGAGLIAASVTGLSANRLFTPTP
jgi:hypothetical protein